MFCSHPFEASRQYLPVLLHPKNDMGFEKDLNSCSVLNANIENLNPGTKRKLDMKLMHLLMAVFILKTHYLSGRTWANICSSSGYASLVYKYEHKMYYASRQTIPHSALFKTYFKG